MVLWKFTGLVTTPRPAKQARAKTRVTGDVDCLDPILR